MPFQFDDCKILTTPAVVDGWKGLPQMFDDKFVGSRPLSMLLFNIQYDLFAKDVAPWHIFNLCLHFVACFLVFRLAWEFLRPVEANEGHRGFVALCAMLLFAFNPVQVYAVAYVTQRMEILGALSVLGSLLFWIQGRRYLACLVFGLGCFCKETAFITPLFILAWEKFYGGKKIVEKFHLTKEGHHILLPVPGFFSYLRYSRMILVLTMCGIGGLVLNPGLRGVFTGATNFNNLGPLFAIQTPLVAMDLIVEYTKRILLPYPGWHSLDMNYEGIQNNLLLIGGMVLFLGFFCWDRQRRLGKITVNSADGSVFTHIIPPEFLVHKRVYMKTFAFCVVLYFLSWLLYSIMTPRLADKFVMYRAYLAVFPMSLLVVLVLNRFNKTVLTIAMMIVLPVFCYWTYKSTLNFETEEVLWKDCFEKNVRKMRPAYNYAFLLQAKGDKDKALKLYGWVIKLYGEKQDPLENETECVINARNNMGVIYCERKEYQQAIECFEPIVSYTRIADKNLELARTGLGEQLYGRRN